FTLLEDWLKTSGRAVISVVHDLSLARAFGTRAALLGGGKLIACGAAQDVLSDENLRTVYGMDVRGWMRGLLERW
ncbi:MAG TPA: ABC transporter ATP-binding protein, partial [Oscillospiraceae bacterium]|nr:ABC transporter ATP-binding protein [Oscillospiraceae bacterium]